MYKRPRASFQTSYRRQRKGYDPLTLAVPSAMIGVVLAIAFTLIYVVVIRGPDTHANIWNEVRPGYQRTEVSYVPLVAVPPPPTTSEEMSFSKDVLPIFQSKCIACHGLVISFKGVSLTSYEAVMNTVVEGQPIVRPGDPNSSLLLQVLLRGTSVMPPTGQLPEGKINLIEKWIAQGAQDN